MAFDFKKEYREFYLPPAKPGIVTVPTMNFVAVSGAGDPNDEDGAYQQAVGALYAIAYTIKMSYKGGCEIEGYFPYVVPPLEGFWWQEGQAGVDYSHKETFEWTSVIRLPAFVTPDVFDWACAEAARKKKLDCSAAGFSTINEGLCVQAMHLGSYDDEPATIAAMDAYAVDQGYELDFCDERHHHEIYLSDPRRTTPEKCKTVIRHPVRRK